MHGAKSFDGAKNAIRRGYSTKSLKRAQNITRDAMQVGWLGGWYESEEVSQQPLVFAVEAGIFDQPFQEAVDALKQKVVMPSETWAEATGVIQNRAFTSAGVTRASVLQTMLNAVIEAEESGLSFRQFDERIDSAVQAMGWEKGGFRRQLVYRQNLSWSFGAGRNQQQEQLITSAPEREWYRMYKHGGSARPRPHHLALDGLVLRANDPSWGTIMPPNGFGCSCSTYMLTRSDLDAEGLKPGSLPQRATITDPATGEGVSVPAIEVGGKLTPIPDPGFSYRPGTEPLIMPDLDPALRRAVGG